MSWWSEFANRIEHDVPVGRQTWFRLGGNARHLFKPRDAEDLSLLVARAAREGVPFKVLGGGANVLVSDDGFDGVVVRLDGDAFRKIERDGSSFDLGAGVDVAQVARRCCREGLSGLECMAGIPSTVGGAVRMNAGGRFGEFGGVVKRVDVVHSDGRRDTLSHEQVGFAYRRTDLGDSVVVSARIELAEDDPQRVRRVYDEHSSLKEQSQPAEGRSAGCIFKNPPGQSAGALIDQAGLKGTRCGEAEVSRRHANFIVARDGATASDVMRLIERVRERVRNVFGTELELEIDIWGPSSVGRSCP